MGRPSPTEPQTQLHVQVPASLHYRFKVATAVRQQTISEAVRIGMEFYISQVPNIDELVKSRREP